MAKKYRVRSGSIDTWVKADGYGDALQKALNNVTSGDKIGSVAVVLQEGDDEKLAVTYAVDKKYVWSEGEKLPEADFSTPDFVWHQDGETYFVCEKDGYDLEVEQIDNEEWICRLSVSFNKLMEGVCKSKMQAVGRCEGFCLYMMSLLGK